MEIEQIIIDRKVSEQSVSEDVSREEEKWTEAHDEYLNKLHAQCQASSAGHHKAAKHNKLLYRCIAVPSITLPLLGGFLDTLISEELVWLPRAVVLLAAGTSAIGNVYNFGKLTQHHTQFTGLYSDLAQKISYTLTRRKRSREACDVSMTKYIHKHQLLGAAAPDL